MKGKNIQERMKLISVKLYPKVMDETVSIIVEEVKSAIS